MLSTSMPRVMQRVAFITVAVLTFALLAGCQGMDYDKAKGLYDEGKYEEALAVFNSLGDYEDSKDMVVACKYGMANALFDEGDYQAAADMYAEISGYKDSDKKAQKAKHSALLATYGDAIGLLEGNTWYFNGGSDTVLKCLTFEDGVAKITEVTFDGNGRHEAKANELDYTIDDSQISLILKDGSEMAIPYTVKKSSITLGDGEYFSAEQIDEGLQGYWKLTAEENPLGSKVVKYEYNWHIADGKMTYQYANEGLNLAPGEYYYLDPATAPYKLTLGGFDSNLGHSREFGFNIIDGKVALLRYDHVASPADGMPDVNSYQF